MGEIGALFERIPLFFSSDKFQVGPRDREDLCAVAAPPELEQLRMKLGGSQESPYLFKIRLGETPVSFEMRGQLRIVQRELFGNRETPVSLR
jgi:hypothetical protein